MPEITFIHSLQDILTILLIIAVFLLCLVLIRLFRVLGVLKDVLDDIQDTVDMIQGYLWQPVQLFRNIKGKFSSLLGFFMPSKKKKK